MTPINERLHEVGQSIGIDGMSLDENGYAVLMFDETVVNLEADADGTELVMYAHVAEISPHGDLDPQLCETLLNANFFHIGTGGATLGLDRSAGFVALVRRLTVAGLAATQLEQQIEQFVNLAEAWTDRLNASGPSGGGDSAADVSASSAIRI